MSDRPKMSLEGLLLPEFTIAGATFRIRRADAETGFDILEKIRSAIADPSAMSKAARDGTTEPEAGLALMQAIMSIEPQRVKSIREDVFGLVEVNPPAVGQFVPMREVRPVVMDLIEPLDNYEIIVRVLAVNFTKSFRGLLSRLGLGLAKAPVTQG